jgi:hypothetical protein
MALLAILHLFALGILLWSEVDVVGRAVFILAWGLVNFALLAALRRPAISAGLSLTLVVVLILLSRFKHDVQMMTVSFFDVMIIDTDTIAFLFAVFPHLGWMVAGAAAVVLPLARAVARIGFRSGGVSGSSERHCALSAE